MGSSGEKSPRVVQALKTRIAEPLGGPLDDLVKAERDFAAGKLTAQEYRTAVDVADAPEREPDVSGTDDEHAHGRMVGADE